MIKITYPLCSFVIFVILIIRPQVSAFLMNKNNSKVQTNSSIPPLAEPPLKIGSFNIQVFGRTKNNIPEVVNVLVKVSTSVFPVMQALRPLSVFFKPFSKRQILDASKLKEFADDNFKLIENGRKLSKQVENTVGKGEIAHYEQFLLFPQCFK